MNFSKTTCFHVFNPRNYEATSTMAIYTVTVITILTHIEYKLFVIILVVKL